MLKISNSNKWKKQGIVLKATEPWEKRGLKNFTCDVELLPNNQVRLWYYINIWVDGANTKINRQLGVAEGTIGKKLNHYRVETNPQKVNNAKYSISNLPESWGPVQPVHIKLQNNKHRLYFWAHAPGVVRYLVAESSDGYHYTVIDPHNAVLYHPHDRAVNISDIPDGLTHFGNQDFKQPDYEPQAPEHLISNDATNVYQLEDGTFEMYSVGLIPVNKNDSRYIQHDNAAGVIRVIDRYESKDGILFSPSQRILTPDHLDPSDLQFYYLSVTHTPQGRIGLLGHYRCQAQTMDIELCFSKDGINWKRPFRKPWIQRGDVGDCDSYGIYAPHNLVKHNGKWLLFYTGINYAHNFRDTHNKPQSAIMMAEINSIFE